MKKLSIIISLAIILISCNGTSQNTIKRYDVKSGIVNYKTTVNGEIMGSKISGSGVEELYFKEYGSIELKELKSSQTTYIKLFDKEQNETTETHNMTKIENGLIYTVDFKNELIISTESAAMMSMEDNADAQQTGKEMMIAMGGEKIADETFMGYDCEVWTLLGAKQWLHKGVLLKLESNLLGIKTLTEAVSIKFNVSVPEDNFKLPNYKIQESANQMNNDDFNGSMMDDEMNGEMDKEMEKLSKMSYEEWKKGAIANDEEMSEMSEEELRQTYDMIQKMIKMQQKE
ncbi:hypothetical protein ERX46_08535 [Brumimicrobium glaciale]|uniref:DUF4412 domain-containing protein n=1 Tax=Brumimicrobium glaciale TaxID=200475 RepID=A0A4Q4KKV4_9FLAO|nr:hypothetical protein [Brumimicrobium glaciale]RYM34003.1 hypothetical protein ERX46_08535 [Brumimicrobium glaciale]